MTLKITCNTCNTIEESCKQAVQLAVKNNEDVVFEFNFIKMRAVPESNPNELINEYLMNYAVLSSRVLSLEFFDQVNIESLLPQYLSDVSKNNKQKLT